MKLTSIPRRCALTLASISFVLGSAALAQAPAPAPATLERVIITGSHIPQIEIETALPVQIFTREEIERTGVTTPAELLDKVPANIYGLNDAVTVTSAGSPGLSSANLRGLGDGATLVLLNGRRLANYAFYGAAADINSIPLSAVERVEVLKDGASAIYGSDAIAGVVNFVLRKDYRGAEFTGYGTATQHGGGNTWLAIGTVGIGNRATDRYNAFVSASYQRNESLSGAERGITNYRPDLGPTISLSSLTFPANIVDQARRRNVNPTFAQGCTPPSSLPVPPLACGYDLTPQTDLLPAVERASAFARGTWQANPATELFAEVLWSRNTFDKTLAPAPIQPSTPTGPNLYPAGGAYYPTEFAAANGLSGDLLLLYRTVELGPRTNTVVSDAQRYAMGAEGSVEVDGGQWDYSVAATYNRNTQSDEYTGGNVYASKLVPAMRTGLINPFGPSGPEGQALLEASEYTGTPHDSEGTTSAINAFASGALATLPAGPLTLAIGADARRERLRTNWDPALQSGDPALGARPLSVGGDRSAWALFAELAVPIVRDFEAQLALRFDDYSDFGSTTNPKVALRWQPLQALLLRTSWGTGFRAPPLYSLYRRASSELRLNNVSDPVRCPVTGLPADCRATVEFTFSGNPGLQPETSTQFNAGIVWQPTPGLSIGIDYWSIDVDDRITGLSPSVALEYYDTYSDRFVRGPVDSAFPDLPGPLTGFQGSEVNLGRTTTSGYDVSIIWTGPAADWGTVQAGLQGTYITNWETTLNGVNMVSMLGTQAYLAVIPRWRSLFTLGWNRGPWGATLTQNYTHGYTDFAPGVDGQPRRVDAYALWDLQATYVTLANWRFAAGVKNLLNTEPSATNKPAGFFPGYNPVLTYPLGRLFYLRATFAVR